MIQPQDLILMPLDKVSDDRIQGFSCGNNLVSDYINTSYMARKDHLLGIASTTVILYHGNVVGFFTACCTQVEIPEEESKALGLSHLYVPAIEVKYLAVSEGYQGRGIGSAVLKTIIADAYHLSQRFACRYIFLWSVPDPRALSFYQNSFFIDTGARNANHLCMMMFQLPHDIDEDEY